MAHFIVEHNQAIWETTTFEVKVPDPLPEGYESPVDYIRDNIDELMAKAFEDDTATIESGDTVGNVDSDIEIRDQDGKQVYTDVEHRKDD